MTDTCTAASPTAYFENRPPMEIHAVYKHLAFGEPTSMRTLCRLASVKR